MDYRLPRIINFICEAPRLKILYSDREQKKEKIYRNG